MCNDQQKSCFRWQEVAYAAGILLLIGAVVFYVRQPKLAVLNLKVVATELGAEKVMRAELVAMKKEAAGQVEKLRDGFKADVERLKERIAQAESEDEKMSLRKELMDIQQKAEMAAKRIEIGMVKKSEEMVLVFHAKLKPSIDAVARKHRIDVVIDSRKETGVLYANARVDLTSEIIKKAQDSGEFKNLSLTKDIPVEAGDESLVGENGADLTDVDVAAPVAAPVAAKPAVAVPVDDEKAPASKKEKTR